MTDETKATTLSGWGEGDSSAIATAVLSAEVRALQRQIRELRAENVSLRRKAQRAADLVAALDVEQSVAEADRPLPLPDPDVRGQEVEAAEVDPFPWVYRPPRPTRKWERYIRDPEPTPGVAVAEVTTLGSLPSGSAKNPPFTTGT